MANLVLKNRTVISLLFIVISVFCLTFIRPFAIFIYPIIILIFIFLFKNKFTTTLVLFLLFGVLLSLISMFYEGIFFINYITSLYLVFSPLIILTLKAKPIFPELKEGLFDSFFKIFAITLGIVNISAFVYAIIVLSNAAYPDDVFTGLYGKSGFGSHSLSIINTAVSVYFFQIKKIKYFIFFFASGILGFYGLGLMIFVATIGILGAPYLIKKPKLVVKGLLISSFFIWTIYLVNPKNIDYILLNIQDVKKVFTSYQYEEEMEKVTNYERTVVPRYFTFVDGAKRLFFSDIKVFLLGTSPGTFNSRTAFYLNGDFVQNKFIKKYFSKNTTYHDNYVLPILNRKLITEKKWMDGTRNQPFSSIVSVFLEYGFIIGFSFFYIFFSKIRKVKKQTISSAKKNYLKFLSIFLMLLFLVQNYIEYPEIILYFILVIKLIEIDNTNKSDDTEELQSL